MSELDALPPDQRAALQLLLKQGQGYDQIADLLGIDAEAVRARAHAGLEALGPEAGRRLSAERRAQVADYLLGQQAEPERDATRRLLAESAGARAWARGLSSALRPVAAGDLPEIPAEGAGREAAAAESKPAAESEPSEAEPAGYESAPSGAGATQRSARPSSRLGGALLLGGVGVAIAVVLVIVLTGGGDGKKSTASTTPTGTATTQQRPVAQINLISARGNSRQVGLAQVFENGNRRALIVAGQGLSPGAYALWVYNRRSDAELLGFVPQRVGRDGRFATQGELPRNAEKFRQLVVTRERITSSTRRPPSRPGQIVLQGDLKLG
jgi:hypothetical protein